MSLDEDTEKILKERKGLSKFTADTMAAHSFGLAVMIPTEYLILGMESEEVLYSRIGGALSNTFLGRPYGIYRDWVFKKMDTTEESSKAKQYLTDILAAETFNLPVYGLILAVATGGDYDQVMAGVGLMSIMSLVIGRPLGWWYDTVRKFCGVRSQHEQ